MTFQPKHLPTQQILNLINSLSIAYYFGTQKWYGFGKQPRLAEVLAKWLRPTVGAINTIPKVQRNFLLS